MRRPDHVRDDENREMVETEYPFTRCGMWVAEPEEQIKYSVPPERVITKATAKKRVDADLLDHGVCQRCVASINS